MIELPFSAPAEFIGAVRPPSAPLSSALWFVFRENFDRRIALGMAATLGLMGVVHFAAPKPFDAIVPEPAGGAHVDPEGAVRLLRPALRRALAEAMRGRGSARRSRREARLRAVGLPPESSRRRLIGEAVEDALGDVRGAIGARLRRREQREAADGTAGED